MIRAGEFPQPYRVGRTAVRWSEREIEAWPALPRSHGDGLHCVRKGKMKRRVDCGRADHRPRQAVVYPAGRRRTFASAPVTYAAHWSIRPRRFSNIRPANSSARRRFLPDVPAPLANGVRHAGALAGPGSERRPEPVRRGAVGKPPISHKLRRSARTAGSLPGRRDDREPVIPYRLDTPLAEAIHARSRESSDEHPPRTAGQRFDAGYSDKRRRDRLRRVPVDQLLQLLAGFEVSDALRRHVHPVAGPGVAHPVRPAAPKTETAEAGKFDFTPLGAVPPRCCRTGCRR